MSRIIVFILVAILLVAGAWYAMNRQMSTKTDQSEATPGATQSETSTDQTADAGQYLTYSGDLSIGTGRRLLFFHAPWCSQCRAIEQTIVSEGVPSRNSVIKVDYDSSQELRKRYGVTIQTTFVEINQEGNLIDKYVAYDEPTIAAVSRHFKLE